MSCCNRQRQKSSPNIIPKAGNVLSGDTTINNSTYTVPESNVSNTEIQTIKKLSPSQAKLLFSFLLLLVGGNNG